MIRLQQVATKELDWSVALAGLRARLASVEGLRTLVESYLKVLSGTFGRLALQTVYFLVLVNTLSLEDMGAFAAISATGLMIGCFSAFGFSSVAFRAAAGRWRLLGAYTALFYGFSALTMPLALLAALPVYWFVFAGKVSFLVFAAIVVSETTCYRMIDGLHAICNGLGRYAKGASLLIFFAGARAAAALGILISGSHALESWAFAYFGTNVVCLVVALVFFSPRVKLRWHPGLLVGRFKESILFAFVTFTADAQKEIDKLVLIVMVDERAAGLYAIASRVIELATVPIKTFYILYSRKLIQDQSRTDVVAKNLRIEGGVAIASFVCYAGFVAVTHFFPNILGGNIAASRPLYAAMLLVPVFKNMMDLHAELLFAYRRMGSRALLLLGLIVMKVAGLAALVEMASDPAWWGAGLNGVFAVLYAISAVGTYSVIAQSARRG